ncbi:MAG: hypothetical protein GZ093_06125 [Rhodoferax sp.]|nr:hypothetical protein [Rhodoferax sp.]
MIFQNLSTQIYGVGLVEQRGSRECTKNAFADKPLAAKRIARHSCWARIETAMW